MKREDLYTTAVMARLKLSEEELARFEKEVSRILEYFSKMMEVEVEDLPPTTHALLKENRLREDEPAGEDCADLLLQNAPELEERFIVIPNVL